MTPPDRRPFALVVDDDAIIRMDAADILEEFGFRTYEAGDAAAALAVLRQHGASVVLLFTDVDMPGPMNGFGLARATAETWPEIGIMVASGHFRPAPGDMPDGAHFVGKPFTAEAIRDRLKQLLPDDRKPEPLKD